jgi:hypothetical protein
VKYRAYLRTDHWQAKRQEALTHYGRSCARCEATGKLHVHHKTYQRLFKERITDLEILCERCHRQAHGIDRRTEMLDNREFTVTVLPYVPPKRRKKAKVWRKGVHADSQRGVSRSKKRRRLVAQNDALHEVQDRAKKKRLIAENEVLRRRQAEQPGAWHRRA